MSNFNSQSRLTGYFYSKTVLNLNQKVLSDTEIRILEKSLYYASIQNKVDKSELRQDFDKFSVFLLADSLCRFSGESPRELWELLQTSARGGLFGKTRVLPCVFLFVYWLSIYLFYLLFTYSYIYLLFTLKVLFIRSCINSVVEYCVAISTNCVVILVK